MVFLGSDEGEEPALGVLLLLGRRRRRGRLVDLAAVLLLAAAADAAAGVVGEAVLPELLPDEPVVDEGRSPEVGQRQPRQEQQLQLVPDRYPESEKQSKPPQKSNKKSGHGLA